MRYFVFLLTTLFLTCCTEGVDASDGPSPAQASKMVRLIENSPSFSSIPQQCPLSVYKTKQNTTSATPDCARQPGLCLALCDAGNRDACFDAAQVIEKADIADDSHLTYPLYMAGCTLGDGNACVNAGATVKNGDWSKPRPAATGTAKCQFTTYDRMCKDGHSWGCYMVAIEYNRSDGYRPKNTPKYEANMRRACKLDADSGACLDGFK